MLRLKKTAITAFALAAMVLPSAAMAGYSAMAGGYGGWGTARGYPTMEAARAAAKRACRNAGYGSCERSVAQDDSWYFSAVQCDGETYIGGSPRGHWRSQEIAIAKGNADGRSNCYAVGDH